MCTIYNYVKIKFVWFSPKQRTYLREAELAVRYLTQCVDLLFAQRS